jgi:hypothetical protein
MNAIPLLIALSATGIDFGWEPVVGGGIHYIVQIDPKMLDSMKEGTIVSSDLPEVPGGIRRYQIVVGTGPLPHQGEPLPQMPLPTAVPPVTPTAVAPPPAAPPVITDPPAATRPSAAPPYIQPPAVQPPAVQPPPTEAPTTQPSTPAPEPTLTHESPVVTTSPPGTMQPGTTSSAGAISTPRFSSPATFAPNRSTDPAPTPQPALDHSVMSQPADPPVEEKPWTALMLTLMGLFASLGGNVFLGMVAWSQRVRFDELAARLKRGLT